jgi:hypothetical protein
MVTPVAPQITMEVNFFLAFTRVLDLLILLDNVLVFHYFPFQGDWSSLLANPSF